MAQALVHVVNAAREPTNVLARASANATMESGSIKIVDLVLHVYKMGIMLFIAIMPSLLRSIPTPNHLIFYPR